MQYFPTPTTNFPPFSLAAVAFCAFLKCKSSEILCTLSLLLLLLLLSLSAGLYKIL